MRYSILASIYEKLEATSKKLEKRDILAELYAKCSEAELHIVVLLSMGTVATEQELGIANEMMRRIIMRTYGVTEKDVVKKFRETGDLGLSAEFFVRNRHQRTLARKELTVEHVFDNLRGLADIGGSGSQEKKVALVSELLSAASPIEARYLVRTVLGEMRIGVAAGIVRDAIAKAFGQQAGDVEHLSHVISDFGRVAELAKKGRMHAEITVGVPIKVMLAERAKDLKSAMDEFSETAIETKYDGFRISIHKSGNDVKIFSRRLDDVTNQFPEIAQWSRECIRARECITEGEAVAIDRHGRPLPFQKLSRRIQRKYDIDRMVKEIPVQVNLFDLVYWNGESWMKRPLRERWSKLKSIIESKREKFQLADHIETKDFDKANAFYKAALAAGQEGVIIKNLDAHYQPGKRVGFWLKVKQIL
ncbi:MAG: ATP-dependent DNA ligase, partial [Candidatus Aenigmarchaeota archaeon]|nr:ATP-dependent DNA ligase [Candidatus Aenigmarchaeota archaeon]